MDSVFSTVLAPILVLWIGALVFYVLDRFLEPQDRGVAEAVVLVLALGFALNVRSQIDVPLDFGRTLAESGWWGMPPFLVASRTTYLLSLLLLGSTLMASLVSLGRPTTGRAGRLAALGAAILFLVAGDWATLAMSWVLVDVFLVHALSAEQTRQQTVRWTGLLSIGGALAIGVALLLWQQGGTSAWVDRNGVLSVGRVAETHAVTELPAGVGGLLALAALLRTMPLPLPTWQAAAEGDEADESRPIVRATVSAIPVILGTYLWARLAAWGGVQDTGWLVVLPVWGALALLVGACKTWGVQEPDRLVACAHIYSGAMVLVGAGLGLPASWQLLVGVNAILSTLTLFVAWTQCQHLRILDVRSYWRAAPTLLVLLSVVGFPLTIGFPARVAVYWSVYDQKKWLSLLLIIAAEALFLGALLRVLLELECVLDPTLQDATGDRPGDGRHMLSVGARRVNWQREIGYGASALLALAIVVLGVSPRLLSAPSLGTWFRLPVLQLWAALLLPTIGAGLVYRARDRILDVMESWWPLAQRVLSLDWLYKGLETVLRHLGAVIWGGALVVEGAGYMAWVVLACLLIVLFVIAR